MTVTDAKSGGTPSVLLEANKEQEENNVELDQILDLGDHETTQQLPSSPLAAPVIAFENSITPSPKQEVPTAGTKLEFSACFGYFANITKA